MGGWRALRENKRPGKNRKLLEEGDERTWRILETWRLAATSNASNRRCNRIQCGKGALQKDVRTEANARSLRTPSRQSKAISIERRLCCAHRSTPLGMNYVFERKFIQETSATSRWRAFDAHIDSPSLLQSDVIGRQCSTWHSFLSYFCSR